MKIFIRFIILIFLISPIASKASDIYDFEIEGISIGGSVLDYFTSYQINQGKQNWYKDNTYTAIAIQNSNLFEFYDEVQINFLTDDKKKIIKNISGTLFMNYNECLSEMDMLINYFNGMITDGTFYDKQTYTTKFDNKTEITYAYWDIKSGSVLVQCYDFDEGGELSVAIDTIEFFDFLSNSAYK